MSEPLVISHTQTYIYIPQIHAIQHKTINKTGIHNYISSPYRLDWLYKMVQMEQTPLERRCILWVVSMACGSAKFVCTTVQISCGTGRSVAPPRFTYMYDIQKPQQ